MFEVRCATAVPSIRLFKNTICFFQVKVFYNIQIFIHYIIWPIYPPIVALGRQPTVQLILTFIHYI